MGYNFEMERSSGDGAPVPFRLSRRVENYIKYRPRYPGEILETLKADCGLREGSVIADAGSGTGILAELFLRDGHRVYGIEPDRDMRAGADYALRRYARFSNVAATAEETTLPAGSVDFVTAGQAFHWFDLEGARREFARILKPGGWVVIVWNIQRAKGTPFLDALQGFWEDERFWKHPSPEAAGRMKRVQAYRLDPELARRELLDPFFGPGEYEETVLENPLKCDLAALQGRVLSNGQSLEAGDPLHGEMLATLEEIFRRYQENGAVTIEHDTRLVYGQLRLR
jgi:SAM-dependent methyltransferase